MSYADIRNNLEDRSRTFARDVFEYLEKTGRSKRGRAYFGVLACNNPNLVERLEAGKLPGLEVMLRVWAYMEQHPPTTCDAGAE
jgi:hypothetical protein